MTKVEVEKALYKEKPTAQVGITLNEDAPAYPYKAKLADGTEVNFLIPPEEFDEDKFSGEMPAHLLRRWLIWND